MAKLCVLDPALKVGITISPGSFGGMLVPAIRNVQREHDLITAYQVFIDGRISDVEYVHRYLYGGYLVIHGPMDINLCGEVQPQTLTEKVLYYTGYDTSFKLNTYIRKVKQQIVDYANPLGCGIIVHAGSCTDKKVGKRVLAASLNVLVASCRGDAHVILENTAHEGNKLCYTLDELAEVCDMVPRLGVCIDTCHLYAAGEETFATRSGVKKFWSTCDKLFGTRLKVIHLNDSAGTHGCRKDRHAPLCQGKIWTKSTLKKFIHEARSRSIPLICETPDGQGYQDVDMINSIVPLCKDV